MGFGIFMIWLMHAFIAGILSAPVIFFGRQRAHWKLWELLAFVLPFLVWTLLMCSQLSAGKKSLANLGEPIFFDLAIPVAALVRVGIGRRLNENVCAGILIGLVCAIAVVVFFVIPLIPE